MRNNRENYMGGQWTPARFTSFIKSALRSASMKWAPIQQVKKEARVRRGFYQCSGCGEVVPATLPPKPGNKRRIKNVLVDHIDPIIDPHTGFTTWDDFVDRLFCEKENLQVLCHACHQEKCEEERQIATERKRNAKES